MGMIESFLDNIGSVPRQLSFSMSSIILIIQVSTFSEIMDTLSDIPGPLGEAGQAGLYTLPGNRPGLNMTEMAPLGPSQVDIGYLGSCRW